MRRKRSFQKPGFARRRARNVDLEAWGIEMLIIINGPFTCSSPSGVVIITNRFGYT